MDLLSLLPRKSHHVSGKCLRYALFTHDWSTVWTFIFMFLALTINCVAFSFVIALNNTSRSKRQRGSRSASEGNEQEEAAEQTELEEAPSNGPYRLINNPPNDFPSTAAKAGSLPHAFRPSWLPRSIPLPDPGLKPRRISHWRQRAAAPRFVQSTLLSIVASTGLFVFILTIFRVALCRPNHTHKIHHPVTVALVFFLVLAVPQIVLGVIAGCHWLGLLAKVCGWQVKTTGIFKAGTMVIFSPVLLVYVLGTWAVANCQKQYCLRGEIDDEEEQELSERGENGDRDVDDLGGFIDEDAESILFNGDAEEEEDEEDGEEDRPPSYEGVMAESSNIAAKPVNQGRK